MRRSIALRGSVPPSEDHAGVQLDRQRRPIQLDDLVVTHTGGRVVVLAPAKYVLIPLARVITGYSEKAIERKIEEGIWTHGKEWIRAPDGRRHICIPGVERWIEGR